MSDQITLEAKTRPTHGTTNSRRLRRLDDGIPGVVYGDQKPTVHISVEQRRIAKAEQDEAFYSQILELKVGRKKERVVLRELQRHPATERVLHIDFLRVSDDRELQTSVPIHYLNEETCEGVKLQGGVVSKNLTDVEIVCLPKDLPEFISVDLADKVVGTSIHLSDLALPEGVSIVALQHGEDHDTQVASVHMPRGISTETEEEEVEDSEGEEQEQEDQDETDSD
ncbi:MAG: 50S ribosomal protein L25/general stress protein Ctc [Gammaproteobacteria bacterium]|nr:50S ribosomal protein L25/general stress protein Ctc [Gammaproteobacteria bacterium]MYF53362.1 50S ribosomal protein L25/general stress protein Ctc [Gammaproteobacteria bacterium]MYK42866.1 50S ribosomal protein L25/general stress protein Ctc [Gammaproteobacteria bacterium]